MHSLSKHSRLIQTAMSIHSHTKNKRLLAGLLICTASLYAPLSNAAPIYKVIDPQTGQVTFTDSPQSYQQSGKTISDTGISTGDTANNRTTATPTENQASQPLSASQTVPPELTVAPNNALTAINYQLTMTEPSEKRAYRRPAQSIVVSVQLKPALQAGDSVSITLDGNEVAQGLNASISTVDILPGSHVINAVVKNAKGQALKQISRTVYVIQNTQTLQNNKKIAQQLLAYQRLPWHQKVLLKLRQDGKQPNMQTFNKPQADKPMTLEQPAIK